MANHVLAIQPQLAEPQEPAAAEKEQEWNQELEVHARVLPEKPESHREQLQWLLPTFDFKKLVF